MDNNINNFNTYSITNNKIENSPAKESYYTAKEKQLNSQNRAKNMQKVGRIYLRSPNIIGNGNIFLRLLGIIIVLLLLASIMRRAGTGDFEYTLPTFSGVLEFFKNFNLKPFNLGVNWGEINSGFLPLDYVVNFFINAFEALFNLIINIGTSFAYVLSFITYFANYLFGIV